MLLQSGAFIAVALGFWHLCPKYAASIYKNGHEENNGTLLGHVDDDLCMLCTLLRVSTGTCACHLKFCIRKGNVDGVK